SSGGGEAEGTAGGLGAYDGGISARACASASATTRAISGSDDVSNQSLIASSSSSGRVAGASSTGEGSKRKTPSPPGAPSIFVKPSSALPKSDGTIHTLFA